MSEIRLSVQTLNMVPGSRQFVKKRYSRRFRCETKKYRLFLRSLSGLYPIRFVCFQFDNEKLDYDPDYLLRLLPVNFHASLWINKHNNRYTIRASRDARKTIKDILRSRGFIFNVKKYIWKLRCKKERKLCRNSVDRVEI